MFGLDFAELLVIAVAALIFIKPGDLPGAMREVGRWIRKLQGMAGDFNRHVDDMMRDSGLSEVKKTVDELRGMNPTTMVEKYVDPKGEIRSALTPPDMSLDPKPASTGAGASASAVAAPAPALAPLAPIVFGAQNAPGLAAPDAPAATPAPVPAPAPAAAPLQPVAFAPQPAPGLEPAGTAASEPVRRAASG